MGHAEVLARLLGSDRSGVAVRVFDGSRAGPADAPVVIDVRSPRALSYIATAPGDLGLARAYVTGAVEVEGDLYTALAHLARLDLELPGRARLRLLRDLGGVRLLRRPRRSGRRSGRHRCPFSACAVLHRHRTGGPGPGARLCHRCGGGRGRPVHRAGAPGPAGPGTAGPRPAAPVAGSGRGPAAAPAAPVRPTLRSSSMSVLRVRCPTSPPHRGTWAWRAPMSPVRWRSRATCTPRWRTWPGWTWNCRAAPGCACCGIWAGSGCCAGRPGPADAPVVIDVRSPRALSYIATAPGDLGLARAYVTGAVEVEGDLYTALAHLARLDLELPGRARLRLLRDLGGVRLLRRPPRSGRRSGRHRCPFSACAVLHRHRTGGPGPGARLCHRCGGGRGRPVHRAGAPGPAGPGTAGPRPAAPVAGSGRGPAAAPAAP